MINPLHGDNLLQKNTDETGSSGGTTANADTSARKGSQVLLGMMHGGHVLEAKAAATAPMLEKREDVITARAARVTAEPEEVLFETPFDYLFDGLTGDAEAHLPATDEATRAAVVAGLKALGDAMVEDSLAVGEGVLQPTGNSIIPPVYTYWGQFIDHDLTANTDRDSAVSDITAPVLAPLEPAFVVENLKNLRQPTPNLDSVYGDGPTFDQANPTKAGRMYDGIKFRIGTVGNDAEIAGVRIPPENDDLRDLPRIGTLIDAGIVRAEDFPEAIRNKPNFRMLAFIADARNDENLIVGQFHTAFLRFHNAVVDWVQANEATDPWGCPWTDITLFERAQQLTRWHYQWLVVNDFLKTITMPGIADQVLLSGPKLYSPRNGEAYMPLEFSVAAYRFGHSMVRAAYDHNRNFGRPGKVIPNAPFNLLFQFTGNGPFPVPAGIEVLPFNWIIEWDRFTDKGGSVPDHFARKIDTRLAPPLRDMVNQGNDSSLGTDIVAILKRLARRNLLRGYLLSMPTGQSVAAAMGVKLLTNDELQLGNSGPMNQVLEDNGFLTKTPLWYYVLKEAEVRSNGNSLGELGSRIVCETIIGQLVNDPESYLGSNCGWNPNMGVKLPSGDLLITIRDFLKFAGLPA